MLLRSLAIIGATLGLLLGVVGTSVPFLFPYIFTHDQMIIREVSSFIFKFRLDMSVVFFVFI